MKRIFGIVIALAFVFAAYAVYAETLAPATAPAKVEAAPAVQPAQVKDAKAEVTDLCKKKGLAGTALDECVKNELAKTAAVKPAEAPKAPVAVAPTAKPEAQKAPVAAQPTAKPVETAKPAK